MCKNIPVFYRLLFGSLVYVHIKSSRNNNNNNNAITISCAHIAFISSEIFLLSPVLLNGKSGTRKLMTMKKALHPRDDLEKIYVSRNERGRGLADIEDCVDASIRQLEDYIEKSKERLITATGKVQTTSINRTKTKIKNKKLENGAKNNYIDISIDKLMKSHTRRPGHG